MLRVSVGTLTYGVWFHYKTIDRPVRRSVFRVVSGTESRKGERLQSGEKLVRERVNVLVTERVTEAHIAEILGKTDDGRPALGAQFTGEAKCSFRDRYRKPAGQKLAVRRALEKVFGSARERKVFWDGLAAARQPKPLESL